MNRIIISQLTEYLEANGLLSSRKLAFQNVRSVEDQSPLTYTEIADRVDSGYIVDIFLDYSKVSDVVYYSSNLIRVLRKLFL